MKITREWAMPNKNTFTIPPIKAFVEDSIRNGGVIIDPFANSCRYGTIRNDLNPEYDTQYHLDALEFLKLQGSNTADVVLYDPPYSITQAAECYSSYGKDKLEVNVSNMGYWKRVKDEIARITKTGGVVLSFGWNSNGEGKGRNFTMTDILIVAHGGSKNDTICTKEVKNIEEQLSLFE